MALSDEALEAWMAAKTNRRPLVRAMSALDGFVTAAVTGPRFPDPQYWMCPLMVRIPVMPDGYSNLKPDRYSDFMPDTIRILIGIPSGHSLESGGLCEVASVVAASSSDLT
ncbi:hypothetical protein [Mesorhizobium sp. AR02]|uniref:hypothetical protein n=1 Tax=Mesorhizobium sp. AR02 TaxID=2865837 RepID=UPI00215FAAA0|nr:hypothetical protein [Mesorhizobium sp. AR02]